MIHESGAWSELNKKWYFLPRRCSSQKRILRDAIVFQNNYSIMQEVNFYWQTCVLTGGVCWIQHDSEVESSFTEFMRMFWTELGS